MHHSVDSLFEDIISKIKDSVRALDEGHNMQLSDLEDKASSLCRALGEMPPSKAKLYEAKFSNLIDYLGGMSDNLQSRQDEVRSELSALDRGHKASTAYKTAASLHNKTPENVD